MDSGATDEPNASCLCAHRGQFTYIRECAITELERQLKDHMQNRLKEEFDKVGRAGKMIGRLEVLMFLGLTAMLAYLFCWIF